VALLDGDGPASTSASDRTLAVHDVKVIDPVTRIEGHAKISLHLDEAGGHRRPLPRDGVPRVRGVLPWAARHGDAGLTARTCGICPVSHLLASAKAGDAIMGVHAAGRRPAAPAGEPRARSSSRHALSFFHLSHPTCCSAWTPIPAGRNVFGLMEPARPRAPRHPAAPVRPGGHRRGHRPRIHGPGSCGGVAQPMTEDRPARCCALVEEAKAAAHDTLELFVGILDRFEPGDRGVRDASPACSSRTTNADGTWEHYGDRIASSTPPAGRRIDTSPADYRECLGERSATATRT
jgi:NAD-reducing hydrogenase large subunit